MYTKPGCSAGSERVLGVLSYDSLFLAGRLDSFHPHLVP